MNTQALTPDCLVYRLVCCCLLAAALILNVACPPQAAAQSDSINFSLPQTQTLLLTSPGFEDELDGWDTADDHGMSQVISEAAHKGELGVRITDDQDRQGSSLASMLLPASPKKIYQVTWHGRVLSGKGIGVYLRFHDEQGKQLNPWPKANDAKPLQPGGQWRSYTLEAISPPNTANVSIWVRAYVGDQVVADLDDFQLVEKSPVTEPNRERVYKIDPRQHPERLTEADVVGPDGLVYPDWRWAGVTGGIPNAEPALYMADRGAKPGTDISQLIESAAREVGQNGGAIILGPGEYFLDQPVIITNDDVVLRGAGADKTRLVFRYRIPYGQVQFFRTHDGDRLGRLDTLAVHTNPRELEHIELYCGDDRITGQSRKPHWGNRFWTQASVGQLIDSIGAGRHQFTAIATYANGDEFTQTIEVELVDEMFGEPLPEQLGAINFVGRGLRGEQIALVADGQRGSRQITLTDDHGLQLGDRVLLEAPLTERWAQLVGHRSPWGSQGRNQYEVVAVDGPMIEINQPLRITFPIIDGSYVQRLHAVSGVGLEGVLLEQQIITTGEPGPIDTRTRWHAIEDLWTNGVTFNYAWDSWLRDTVIKNAGKHAAYFPRTKFIEIRDCTFDGAIFKGGGGTGYVGFERSYDCLMDNVTTHGMRHGPNVQWSSSGNVIRNSSFHGSDGQWHAGWTTENLFENNLIVSETANGGYGHGLFASGPTSNAHGPQGPRNVVYRNDIYSPKDAIYMLGGNENWLILHNRFTVDEGRAIVGKETSFDHIIAGNVFVIHKAKNPVVWFKTPDCAGIELINNTFYGAEQPLFEIAGGTNDLAVNRGNTLRPLDVTPPDLPEPEFPSIFDWQKNQLPLIH